MSHQVDIHLIIHVCLSSFLDHIPADLRDPFYTDQYDQEHIKPLVIRLLLSGELYCRVCRLILQAEQAASLQSHQSVIQALSRKGTFVLKTDNTPVSDLDLSTTPIKMSSHIHLIDALMMAYIVEMISTEKVLSSVKRFSNFSASKELPFDLEDAMVFWINKVNIKMREIMEKELKMKQHLMESPSHQKVPACVSHTLFVRYRRDHLSGRTLQHFPLLDDLLKDVCDGMALLAVVHFYCPELIRLEDICLKEVPSIADCVYNIQLLQEFCNEYLDKCFYLKPEDMLYSPPVLKNNVMVFIAELFWWFENVKPDFVQPRDLHEIRDVRLLLQPKSSRSHIPISNITKRSFLTSSNSADILTMSQNLEEDDEDDQMELTKEVVKRGKGEVCEFAEGESAKLREDSKISERDDKEGGSGRSSPCLSTISWASSCSASGSTSVKMTSFAERKLLKLGLLDGFSSTSSSQKTTPDGSEVAPCPPWQLRSDCTSGWLGKEPSSVLGKNMVVSPPIVPSELLQLHMQLEEQRRAIEYQKKKMETLSARQRLKLGKAAFLNIVKKGGGKSDTLPLPIKHYQESSELADRSKVKTQSCKDDSCLDALKVQAKTGQTEGAQMNRNNRLNTLSQDNVAEPDLNECSHSIDLLNDAISSIQQQMMQLSLQQDLLMKRVVSPPEPLMERVVSPPELPMNRVTSPPERVESNPGTTPDTTTQSTSSTSDSRSFAVHFVDISGSNTAPARRPPKLSSSQRSKASEQKLSKENSKMASVKSNTQSLECRDNSGRFQDRGIAESSRLERSIQRNTTFRVPNDLDQQSSGEGTGCFLDNTLMSPSQAADQEENNVANLGLEAVGGDENARVKGQLIKVDLSELKDPLENGSADVIDCTAEGEPKNALGFFFKDEEKAEDEMAKRRAAFLLKQQRKAEEARLRKQQQEVEIEVKRDEARRKAEEDRVRKEEEKARREIIKQEYLQRKQEALMEEQGLVKPRPRTKSRRSRPKSLHREESNSLSKASTTAGSACSMETFPMLSRASSRNMERDWENGSIASSITSTEYNGPKLFKEPSSKSNKPIIINAIAHCCLAGKVNETQKNVILEELEKCESNHLIILFRDSGCQFRAIYSYSPDTEEIIKFTGTGPRSISRKMIDKLYKYSSDRKQFNVIPAKSVSVSVDALTIHNQLWQVKRPGSARRK
uniref:Calmodulin regulated spectrin-associated protein 1a n=1 Tax=Sander lucioperca TaxID=283035 RepID=A0A8C9Z1M1_SANLU